MKLLQVVEDEHEGGNRRCADPAERGTQQIPEPSDVVGRRRIFEPPFGPGAGG